jgi:predicted NUDIX family NTP pyrophosphohydrolase
MYRRHGAQLEVFLVHPGGPFWVHKDLGAWTIPKGHPEPGELPIDAAQREFEEETGFIPHGTFTGLGDIRQPGGKLVTVWAFEGDCDPARLRSNTTRIEWPPHSGRKVEVPEIDRGGWFSLAEAREKILIGQAPFLDRLLQALAT